MTSPTVNPAATDDNQNDQLIDLVSAFLGVSDPQDALEAFAPSADLKRVEACVQDAGFKYFTYVPLANDPSVTMTAHDYASTWGFGITAQLLGTYPKPSTEDVDYLASLSEAERSAYDAVVERCTATAGLDTGRNAAIESAANRFRADLAIDPTLQAATRTWSACMSEQGYDYASPDDLRQHFWSTAAKPATDLQAVFQIEKQTAVANLACEPAYRTKYQDLVIQRFNDFEAILAQPAPPGDGSNG